MASAFKTWNYKIPVFIIKATTPPTIGELFYTGYPATNIYVPDSSVDAYKSAWSAYVDNIKPISEYSGDIPPTDY